MSDRRPYSRVYWSIRSDLKFAEIYRDARRLGTWLQLLIGADALYPEPADLPRTVSTKDFRALVSCGLVDDLGYGQYRVHGLEAEREQRSSAARIGGMARSERSPNGHQTVPERVADGLLAKLSQAKLSTSLAEAPRETDPADAYWSLTGRYPVGKVIAWIDDLAGRYGQDATTRATVKAHMEDGNVSTLLGRASNLLAAEARALDRKERADEQERLREKRAVPPVIRQWNEAERAETWEKWRETLRLAAAGKHPESAA